MKKLYRKGAVHPSSPSTVEDQLSILSATLLTLTASLSPQDKQVLAYLISCTNNNIGYYGSTRTSDDHHHVMFNCHCFSCYTSYWAKWDASPNRQVIHEIIEAFEDELMSSKKSKKTRKKKDKKKKKEKSSKDSVLEVDDDGDDKQVSCEHVEASDKDLVVMDGVANDDAVVEKGTLRKFVTLICEKIWSVLGHNKDVDQGK